jgi:hypothetical protein
MFTGISTRLLTPGNGSNRRRNPPNHGLKPRGLRRVQSVIAAGHNMLGLSMAPATGKLVAGLLGGHEPFLDPRPYRISRF